MRKLTFILLILSFQIGFSQNTQLDSLNKIINQSEKNNDNASIIENSIKLSKVISKSEGDSIAIVELKKREANLVGAPDSTKGMFYQRIGLMNLELYQQFRTLNFVEEAFINYQKAVPLLESSNHKLLPNTQSQLGLVYQLKEDNIKAISYLKSATELFKQTNQTTSEVRALMNLASAYSSIGNFNKNIENSRKAIELVKKLDDPNLQAQVYLSYAGRLLDMKEHKAAENNFIIALEYARQANDSYLISYALSSLGHIHVAKFDDIYDLEKGKKELDEAIKMQKEIGDVYSLASSNNFMSIYYLNAGNIKKAIEYSDKYISFFKKLGEKVSLSDAYWQRGDIYNENEQLDSAAFNLAIALDYAREINKVGLIEICLSGLTTVEKSRENYAAALTYKEEHAALKDSLFNSNLESSLAKEKVKQGIDAEQEAREKAELKASLLSSQNKLFGAIAIGLAGILLIGGYLFTQLRKTRNQLTTQNQQLTDLNATKDKFFGIIAHDIRSPITALDGVSEQMNYYLEKDDKTKLNRLAGRIDATTKRLTSLLDNLLNWALLQTGMIPYNPKSVSIQTVAQENIELFQPVAEAKNISLQNNISSASPVFSDESALNTIVRNLINNAIKFTPAGGKVSIDTEEKGDKVFIKINDTGTGIAADKLEKLFSLEKQSSKGTAGEKGSGLGLMLCKELVELNKGTIRAVSELGKGSSFIFSLPRE